LSLPKQLDCGKWYSTLEDESGHIFYSEVFEVVLIEGAETVFPTLDPPLFSALRFYDDIDKQTRYKSNCENACNFYLKGAASATNITTYNAFGQDSLINSINHSLNFGIEISSLLLTPINDSLYSDYYQVYLENIYNQKARKYNIKAILPISLLTSLKLNNRLIIRDKRYIINNMKIDLTSGEVDFELINDLRTLTEPEPILPDYLSEDYTSDYSI